MKSVITARVLGAAFICTATALSSAALAQRPEDNRFPISDSQRIGAIWLDSNSCTAGISRELEERGFQLAGNRRRADAVLDVQIDQRVASNGRAGAYDATLQRHSGRVLFNASGREQSLNRQDLCADIGEEIADALEDRTAV